MYQKTRAERFKHIDFMLADWLCLVVSFALAMLLRYFGAGPDHTMSLYISLAIVITLVQVAASLMLNSCNNILRRSFFAEFINVGAMAFMMLALISLYLFSAHSAEIYSRLVIYYTMAIYFILDIIVRSIKKKTAIKFHKSKGSKSLLVITKKAYAESIVNEIISDVLSDYRITGLVYTDTDAEAAEESDIAKNVADAGIPVVSDIDNVADYICREWVDEILLYFPDNSSIPQNILDEFAEMGVTVHSVVNLSNVDRNKQFIETIGNRTVLTTAYNYINPYQAFAKRLMDIVGGIVGSIIAIVIGIFIGPVIYISSPGPIIFRQDRVGRNGKIFKVLKFRSMYLDAEERKKDYLAENRVSDGMMFKLDFDPRIIGNKVLPDGTHKTGIGEFIRKTSLDEFPQFFNVLKGDMSLVGTRPPTVDEWDKYQYHHRARLAIKPGITGMWQVSGRSEITDFEEVVRLDTEYICNFRLSLDIKILFKTVLVLFQRKGAM